MCSESVNQHSDSLYYTKSRKFPSVMYDNHCTLMFTIHVTAHLLTKSRLNLFYLFCLNPQTGSSARCDENAECGREPSREIEDTWEQNRPNPGCCVVAEWFRRVGPFRFVFISLYNTSMIPNSSTESLHSSLLCHLVQYLDISHAHALRHECLFGGVYS